MIECGDCLQVLKDMRTCSIDALVTDPPAGISFMGKHWDKDRGGRDAWVAWMTEVMRECLRVMKPGAHGLVWSLPRTSHWTATALEDAGFEVRDVITHLFGTGFPKSLNVGNGWGTALKPACEFWWLVRKPCSEKTVAENVLKWGTGAINVDGCRIAGHNPSIDRRESARKTGNAPGSPGEYGPTIKNRISPEAYKADHPSELLGRFPANLVLDEEAAAMLDEQSGISHSPNKPVKQGGHHRHDVGLTGESRDGFGVGFGDTGGASRFFYVAKASKSDRGPDNNHPTVKSTKLMSYLVRLITPPGGTVLDPFMGSGSTGVAAKSEGFKFVGIEQEQQYFEIAEERLA